MGINELAKFEELRNKRRSVGINANSKLSGHYKGAVLHQERQQYCCNLVLHEFAASLMVTCLLSQVVWYCDV